MASSVNTLLGAALASPVVVVIAALALNLMQRILDFVDQTAKSHTGPLKDFRNIFMNLDVLFDKLFQGGKVGNSNTNVLLMAVVITLIAVLVSISEYTNAVAKASTAAAAAATSADQRRKRD